MHEGRLGLAGWSYPEWSGLFYAQGTPPGQFLRAYARVFRFAEVDSTYYAPPSREDAARWDAATPPGFLFSPKLPKRIVAEKKLEGVAEDVADFLGRLAPLRVAGKLGPVLASMPPGFRREAGTPALRAFLDEWPRDAPLAVELRHKSWWKDATFDLLRAHGAIHVWSVTEYGRTPPVATGRDLYVRLIGDRALDATTSRWDKVRRDQSPEIAYWRDQLRALNEEVYTVFVVANNHFMGYAPETARRVAEALAWPVPDLAAAQGARGLGSF